MMVSDEKSSGTGMDGVRREKAVWEVVLTTEFEKLSTASRFPLKAY
jgi:hypothetical protein